MEDMDAIVQVNVLRAGGEHCVPVVHEPRSPLAVVAAALTLPAAVTLPSRTWRPTRKEEEC